MEDMRSEHSCDECGTRLYHAGETVSSGIYIRIDDGSFQRLLLNSADVLPPSFDGRIAHYRRGAAPCACERRHNQRAALPVIASPSVATETR